MRINALISIVILVAVMTAAVIGLMLFGKMSVQNIPELVLITPAKSSTTALDVVIPESERITRNDLVERPMFWKERRPYVPPVKVEDKKVVVEEPPGPDPFEKITLMGIYSGGVMLKVDGETQRVRIGEMIEGVDWSLNAIGDDNQVVFVFGGEQKILELEHATVKAKFKPKPKPVKPTRKGANRKSESDNNKGSVQKEVVDKRNKPGKSSRVEIGKGLK